MEFLTTNDSDFMKSLRSLFDLCWDIAGSQRPFAKQLEGYRKVLNSEKIKEEHHRQFVRETYQEMLPKIRDVSVSHTDLLTKEDYSIVFNRSGKGLARISVSELYDRAVEMVHLTGQNLERPTDLILRLLILFSYLDHDDLLETRISELKALVEVEKTRKTETSLKSHLETMISRYSNPSTPAESGTLALLNAAKTFVDSPIFGALKTEYEPVFTELGSNLSSKIPEAIGSSVPTALKEFASVADGKKDVISALRKICEVPEVKNIIESTKPVITKVLSTAKEFGADIDADELKELEESSLSEMILSSNIKTEDMDELRKKLGSMMKRK